MKVILNQDVDNLGYVGEIVEVKPGYARNYLLPRKIAVVVNKHNLEVMQNRMKKLEKEIEQTRISSEELKAKIEEMVLRFERKVGENDVLFGSVTVADIEAELNAAGIEFDRKKFTLPEAIKTTGVHICKLRLFRDISAEVKVEVVPEGVEETAEEVAEVQEATEEVISEETTEE